MSLLHDYIRGVLSEGDHVKIAVSGDVMFGRYVGYEYHPLNVINPFRQVQHVFRDSDLSIVNLETPLYDGTPTWWKKYPLPKADYQKTLVAPTKKVNDLINGGIGAVSLANNHADDAGYDGFGSTISALDAAKILHAGTNISGDPFEPALVKIKGRNVVFFSVTLERNFGDNWGDDTEYKPPVAHIDDLQKYEKFLRMIEFQREMSPDAFIIAAVHWGVQYKQDAEAWQEVFAKDIVDAGANCILGHHPHVLQKVSTYKNAVIFFSLGNLLFDHNYDVPGHGSKKNEKTKNGAIYTFNVGADNTVLDLQKHDTLSTPGGVAV